MAKKRTTSLKPQYAHVELALYRTKMYNGSKTSSVASPVANDDEAAAMAAMFQAQTNVWEETQEKMSQLVLV